MSAVFANSILRTWEILGKLRAEPYAWLYWHKMIGPLRRIKPLTSIYNSQHIEPAKTTLDEENFAYAPSGELFKQSAVNDQRRLVVCPVDLCVGDTTVNHL